MPLPPCLFLDASSSMPLLQCLFFDASSSMPLLRCLFLKCLFLHASSSMPLLRCLSLMPFQFLLCPHLFLLSAHCVMPGRLKNMSVCALLREEKPAMHWQRGKKYLHYKELCLNLGQHLFNWVLFRNISQEWPFKSWAVFAFLNFTSLDIKNKVKLSLIKGKIGVFVLYLQTGWFSLSFCNYHFLSIYSDFLSWERNWRTN